MRVPISLKVNGKHVSAEVEPRWSLVEFLRDHLRLTGTQIGCDTSQCSACAVHIDGVALKSCTFFAVQADGSEMTTFEGIARDGQLHPMQAAFQIHHGLQCGFCTPGMIMSALDLVHREAALDEEKFRQGLEGNFCRCTGYYNIVKAVASGAEAMKQETRSET